MILTGSFLFDAYVTKPIFQNYWSTHFVWGINCDDMFKSMLYFEIQLRFERF